MQFFALSSLALAAVLSGPQVTVVSSASSSAVPAAKVGATQLPSRVAAGEVTPTSALLWARPAVTGVVRFEVFNDAGLTELVLDDQSFPANGVQPAKIRVGGLVPGTRYWYRATDSAGNSDLGTFRTAHAPDARHGLVFGISGDGRGDNLPFHSLRNAVDAELDFFVYMGDTIYADIESPALPGVEQAGNLRQFLLKHFEVLSPSPAGANYLGDLRATTAFYATIDDHEVTNDFAGGAHPSSHPLFGTLGDFINETPLFEAGLEAFERAYPVVTRFWGDTGNPRTAFKRKLYRSQDFGLDAAIFLLDARSFRDEPLESPNPTDLASIGTFLAQSFAPDRTMLGLAQVEQLEADLLASHKRGVLWKFVLVPEPIQNLGPVQGQDRFEGYAAERTRLLSFVVDNEIKNVVFVCADIHGTVINDVTFQVGPGQPQIPTGAFEISTGAVAFDKPFGPTVVDLASAAGLLSPLQVAFYDSLPLVAKDGFLQTVLDENVTPFGYSAVGLQDSSIQVEVLEGGYVATHTWGWSEFEIDATTGQLTITTWGIPPFTDTVPTVQSRFRVTPK